MPLALTFLLLNSIILLQKQTIMNNNTIKKTSMTNEALLDKGLKVVEKPMTFSEIQLYLNLSKTTLRKLINEKSIRAYRFNRKLFFYASQINQDLSKFMYVKQEQETITNN